MPSDEWQIVDNASQGYSTVDNRSQDWQSVTLGTGPGIWVVSDSDLYGRRRYGVARYRRYTYVGRESSWRVVNNPR